MTDLWEIQDAAVTALEAVSEFAGLAEAILADDGSYPKTPGREAALNDLGVCMTVLPIGYPNSEVIDQAFDGTVAIAHPITVVLEVRSTATFSLSTLQAEAAKFIHYIIAGMAGKPAAESANHMVFQLRTPPYGAGVKFGGEIRYEVFFWVQSVVAT